MCTFCASNFTRGLNYYKLLFTRLVACEILIGKFKFVWKCFAVGEDSCHQFPEQILHDRAHRCVNYHFRAHGCVDFWQFLVAKFQQILCTSEVEGISSFLKNEWQRFFLTTLASCCCTVLRQAAAAAGAPDCCSKFCKVPAPAQLLLHRRLPGCRNFHTLPVCLSVYLQTWSIFLPAAEEGDTTPPAADFCFSFRFRLPAFPLLL